MCVCVCVCVCVCFVLVRRMYVLRGHTMHGNVFKRFLNKRRRCSLHTWIHSLCLHTYALGATVQTREEKKRGKRRKEGRERHHHTSSSILIHDFLQDHIVLGSWLLSCLHMLRFFFFFLLLPPLLSLLLHSQFWSGKIRMDLSLA